MIQLDVQMSAVISDRYRRVKPAFLHAQIVEQSERFPSEPAELRVVTLTLQLADDDEWQRRRRAPKSAERPRVREQDRGIQDEHAGKLRIRRGGAHGTLQMGSAGDTMRKGAAPDIGTTGLRRGSGGGTAQRPAGAGPARSLVVGTVRDLPVVRLAGSPPETLPGHASACAPGTRFSVGFG